MVSMKDNELVSFDHVQIVNSWYQAKDYLEAPKNLLILERKLEPLIIEIINGIINSDFKATQFVCDSSSPIELIGAFLEEQLKLNVHDPYPFLKEIMDLAAQFLNLS